VVIETTPIVAVARNMRDVIWIIRINIIDDRCSRTQSPVKPRMVRMLVRGASALDSWTATSDEHAMMPSGLPSL
jgi:hypothetical protein